MLLVKAKDKSINRLKMSILQIQAVSYTHLTGWYIGESGKGLGYEYKEEITKTDFKENYLYVYGAFLSNSVENAYSGYSISFNANGGTIDGLSLIHI